MPPAFELSKKTTERKRKEEEDQLQSLSPAALYTHFEPWSL